jgi:hypothetical protein
MATAKQKDAYNQGAQHKRGGISLDRTLMNMEGDDLKAYASYGWDDQKARPDIKIDFSFFLAHVQDKVTPAENYSSNRKEQKMKRNAAQLAAAKTEYQAVYDPYAAAETAAGRTPQPFDEAFAAHLEALDAEAGRPGDEVNAGAAGEDAETVGVKPAKAKVEPKAKAEPKEKAAPKPKGFRPTSDDRKAINAAAESVLKAAKAEGVARCKLPDGSPYVDFLQGKFIKLDADGNGSGQLNVFAAALLDASLGVVNVIVKNGVMTAKGVKA